MPSIINKAKVKENSAAYLTGYLQDKLTGNTIVPADIESLRLRVYDTKAEVPEGEDEEDQYVVPEVLPDGTTPDGTYDGTDLDPADVILHPVNTGPLAKGRSTGINLLVPMHGSYWPEASTYRVELLITPVTGDPYYELWEATATKVISE